MSRTLPNEIMQLLEQAVADRLAEWPKQWEGFHWPGYTYEHTQRVRALARTLAVLAGAEVLVVDLAALLHDLAKPEGAEHARHGAEEAGEMMRGLGLDPTLVEQVAGAIATHSGDNTPIHPAENRILGDADLIDANFGLVATWRFITIRAGTGATILDTVAGLAGWLPRKDELMSLLRSDAGLAAARERSVAMHRFCEDTARAFGGGVDAGLVGLVEFIFGHHERASLTEQLPAMRDLAGADAQAAGDRLAAEVAGEV